MQKSETLHIRVTPGTRSLAERAAKKAKRTLSDFCSLALEEAAQFFLAPGKKGGRK